MTVKEAHGPVRSICYTSVVWCRLICLFFCLCHLSSLLDFRPVEMMTRGEQFSQRCVYIYVCVCMWHSGTSRVWHEDILWHQRQKRVLILDALLRPCAAPQTSPSILTLLPPNFPSFSSFTPPPIPTHSFSPLLPVVCVCVGKIKLLWQSCVYKYAGRETGQATLNRNRIQIAFLSLLGPGREKMCLRLLLLRLWRIKPQYWVWAPC